MEKPKLLCSNGNSNHASYEDDAKILSVVDSYCASAKARHTVNSAVVESAAVIVPHEEKLFIEDADGMIIGERTLVDTVYLMREEMKAMKEQMQQFQHAVLQGQNNNTSRSRNGVLKNDSLTLPIQSKRKENGLVAAE